jgi:hypothetical protein
MLQHHSRTTRHLTRGALALCGALTLAACGADAPSAPRDLTPDAPRLTAYDAATRTLGVSLSGPNKVTSQTWITMKAYVSGGVGPYTYDWFQQYCYADISYCSPMSQIRYNTPDDSIFVEYPGEMRKMRFVVHVRDAQAVPFAGSESRIVINTTQSTITDSGFSCDLGESYYPIVDFDGRHYRRNGCTGAREYDPTP